MWQVIYKLDKVYVKNMPMSWKVANRPIYIGKNQNPKNLGFLLYRLHCQKNP